VTVRRPTLLLLLVVAALLVASAFGAGISDGHF
jgi:hypothetical protein